MSKLLITADVHGSLNCWRNIADQLNPEDCIAVAGDLFDTVYGCEGQPDFQPETIKTDFQKLQCRKYYVYGNCDSRDFFPGHRVLESFTFDNVTFLLNHGHMGKPDLTDFDVIIEGHSHIAGINTIMDKVFINPGSPIFPRKNGPTYASYENGTLAIINFETQMVLQTYHLGF